MEELVKSTHKCEVVPVVLNTHPNADTLSIVPIFGYSYVAKTADWQGVSKAAWLPPDSLCDTTRPEFMFLAGEAKYGPDSSKGGVYHRVKAKRLRGVVSYGLMVPVPDTAIIGEDFAERLGVLHYDPPINTGVARDKLGFMMGGEVEAPPSLYSPKYDVDSFQRYASEMFIENELVHVSEKIHGCNSRFVYHNGKMYCGSRTEWKREYANIPCPEKGVIIARIQEHDKEGVLTPEAIEEKANKIIETISMKNAHPQKNLWWKALHNHPEVEEWCRNNPDVIVYGEVYGAVQSLRYGLNNDVRIAVFDLMRNGEWIDIVDARKQALPWVPVVHNEVTYNFDDLVGLAEGQSLVPGANHIREGVVVRTTKERRHPLLGRCQLKIVSATYLEKS